jgi:hypothetical protein
MPTVRWLAPALLALATLLGFASLARLHPFGTYGTETDFYVYFAPDAERIAAGVAPVSTYHGPGYALILAAAAPLAGDLFTAAKAISVLSMTAVVLLSFFLFRPLLGDWGATGAAALVAVSGRLPQYAISATTDILFLALSLGAIIAITGGGKHRLRAAISGALVGAAWLTRYNAIALAAAIVIAIIAIDFFEQPLRKRVVRAAIFVAAFTIVIAPWLVVNRQLHGSPFYNTNYLNIAKELHPEVAAGYTGDDALLRVGQVFHSFGDVVRDDPAQALGRYALNVAMHVRETSMQPIAWLALIGAAFGIARRSKLVLLFLVMLVLHFAVIGLVHFEARFHFFVVAIDTGLALFAIQQLAEKLEHRRAIAVLAFSALWMMTLAGSVPYVRRMLATHPTEVVAACRSMQERGVAHARILARKPHLPYLCHSEWVRFPQVRSLDELHAWLNANRVDVIFFAVPEAATRREVASLLNPRNAPPWLTPVWASSDPPAVLYVPRAR